MDEHSKKVAREELNEPEDMASALAAFSAEAAALSHKLVSEEARRAAIATTSTNECVVCHERPLEVAFGCGHFCTCVECGISAKLSKCPICRAPVTERRRIYAS